MAEQSVIGHLGSKAKQIVLNVFNYFSSDSGKPGTKAISSIERTSNATGVSRRTICRLRKEKDSTGQLLSPERRQRGSYKPVDDFDRSVIRNKVHEFYAVRRQLPTLANLHVALVEDISYPASRSTLRKTLHELGFRWKKTKDNRHVLIEKSNVISLRLNFFKRKHELEAIGYRLVYIDETWIDTSYCAKACWQGLSTSGVVAPCNKGQRLIVVHAGSRDGFVPGACLIYKASASTGDYHKQMDGNNFTKWLTTQLLPNLEEPSAIVMDNASYHSVQLDKCPNSTTRKAEIKVS